MASVKMNPGRQSAGSNVFLEDPLLPRNLYNRMEREREQNNGTGVRELFAPVFLAKVLREQLTAVGDKGMKSGHFSSQHNRNSPKHPRTLFPNGTPADDYSSRNGFHNGFNGNSRNGHGLTLDNTFFLEETVKRNVEKVLRFGQILNSTAVLNRAKFCQHFCEQIKSPPLELIWLLDAKYDLLSATSYLITLTEKEYFFASDFSHNFIAFCFSPLILENNTKGNAMSILEMFFEALIIADECNQEKNATLLKMRNYSQDILRRITMRLIDDSPTLDQSGHDFILRTINFLPISWSLKQKYFTRQLDHILSQKSQLDVLQVVQKQETLSKLSNNMFKIDTINMVIGPPQLPNKVIQTVISKIRKGDLINWENTLLTVTLWEKMYKEETDAFRLFKDSIKKLMIEGLTENRPFEVSASFILARHCSLIAPETFFRYEKWYNSIFAKENASPIRELHIFSSFVEFLTQWVPVEPPCFLQVQATYWPYIPPAPGCRTVWSEYITLANERIQEYNDIESLMEFELNVNNPLQRDVDSAVRSFASSKQIPHVILEMLLFRRKYYLEQFLPALLKKSRELAHSDARIRLIEALNAESRIPPDLYAEYKLGGL